MNLIKRPHKIKSLLLTTLTLVIVASANAQTTQFTYQGKLTDNGNSANGQSDFQFKLFDTATVGTGAQQGSTLTVSNVTVTAGIFTVQVDFGAAVFPGAARFLEIAVKKTSDSTFTTLGPRQAVAANPYTIHALNADGLSVACVNCISSSQIQTVQGSQVTGNISGSQINGEIPVASVPAGSGNYIQSGTSQQAFASFNVSGDGTAAGTLSGNVLNATTQFNLDGNRILSNAGPDNLFAGIGAGASNLFAGSENSFFGKNAGQANTTGIVNSFFGAGSGLRNMTGAANSFFGAEAGNSNTTGSSNSFFGRDAGLSNSTADRNSFFGFQAGALNTGGGANSFFGADSGLQNTLGGSNSFFGENTGRNNTTGSGNSFFGDIAGRANTIGQANSFFGNFTGSSNTMGSSNSFFGNNAGFRNTTGSNITVIGANADVTANNLDHATVIGAQAVVGTNNTVVLGRNLDTVQIPGALNVSGTVTVTTLGSAGATTLCRNASNAISTCSSSLRYKTNIAPYRNGLDVIAGLKPITFTWKEGGMRDIGLGAEEVEMVEPLLTFRNDKGEIEGVKYSQLSALFINAFKQQQQQIKQQQSQLDALKRLVCRDHPRSGACK